MATELYPAKPEQQRTKVIYQRGASEAVYGMGLIGAWVYYISHAATFWLVVLGIIKGVFWPAMLVYGVLKLLNMQ